MRTHVPWRTVKIGIAAASLLSALALSGCVAAEPGERAEGMGGVWGYVASAKHARLEIAEFQPGGDMLVVRRVLAPENGWVVVHADDDGKPGDRVGLAKVEKGENRDVEVDLQNVTSAKVIVAVHADRAAEGTFDFDMMNKEMSPDRPFFVQEKELAAVVEVGPAKATDSKPDERM